MVKYDKITVLSGAGISAESGISTFRDKDGVWSKYDVNGVATIEAFRRNPKKVLDFYTMRRGPATRVVPDFVERLLDG